MRLNDPIEQLAQDCGPDSRTAWGSRQAGVVTFLRRFKEFIDSRGGRMPAVVTGLGVVLHPAGRRRTLLGVERRGHRLHLSTGRWR